MPGNMNVKFMFNVTGVTLAVGDGSLASRGKPFAFSTLVRTYFFISLKYLFPLIFYLSGGKTYQPAIVDFLDEEIGRNLQLKLSPALRHTWRTCQSNSCRAGCAWRRVQVVGISGSVRHLVLMLSV